VKFRRKPKAFFYILTLSRGIKYSKFAGDNYALGGEMVQFAGRVYADRGETEADLYAKAFRINDIPFKESGYVTSFWHISPEKRLR
jgi:hypothetical protein